MLPRVTSFDHRHTEAPMSNPAFAFPSGPAPHCPLKEGAPDTFLGILEDPTCPGIHSADSPFLILPWVCIGLALLLGAAHLVQRKWGEGGQAGDMDSELPTAKDPATAELANLVFSETLEVESFRRSYLGTGAKYSLFSFYLSLVYMYFIVILDVYIDCELNSWNAMCFFGSYPISGNYNRSSVILYSTWVVVLVTYSHLLIYKEVLPNWYRLPCKARDATHLAVKAPVMEKERHVFNPSSIVLAYRRITNFRKSDKVAIAWETIPVLTTEDGLKYVDYRCSRFVLKGEHYMKAELRLAGTAIGELASQTGGLASGRTRTLLQLVGPNAIPFDVDSYTTSICKEFGRFFYLYQFQMYIPCMRLQRSSNPHVAVPVRLPVQRIKQVPHVLRGICVISPTRRYLVLLPMGGNDVDVCVLTRGLHQHSDHAPGSANYRHAHQAAHGL